MMDAWKLIPINVMLVYNNTTAQIFEWSSMRHLVLWQRYKHTDEALVEMQDDEISAKFKKQEII